MTSGRSQEVRRLLSTLITTSNKQHGLKDDVIDAAREFHRTYMGIGNSEAAYTLHAKVNDLIASEHALTEARLAYAIAIQPKATA